MAAWQERTMRAMIRWRVWRIEPRQEITCVHRKAPPTVAPVSKERLDVVLTRREDVSSRMEARGRILAGHVTVNGAMVSKAGTLVSADAEIVVSGPRARFVSRGGEKLAWALERFDVDVTDYVVLDAGASTGGFTDCLLQAGARMVYALDVGHGQLAWTLRNDPRVRVMEKINIRNATADMFDSPITMATADLAFIGLSKVLHVFVELLPEGADLIALVKPHFEAGREFVGRGGVVRSPEVHRRVLISVASAGASLGLPATGITYSPIRGAAGNIEFLMRMTRGGRKDVITDVDAVVWRTVAEAHARLTVETQAHEGNAT